MKAFKYINMNISYIYKIVLFGVMVLVGFSCGKEFDKDNYNFDVEYTPGFKGPIAHGELSLEDILNVFDTLGLIYTNPDGLINFAYSGKVNRISSEQWLTIPPQEFKEILLTSPATLNPLLFQALVASPIAISDDYEFVFDHDEQIDSIQLIEGILQIIVESTIRHTAVIYLSSSNIYKEGGDTLNETIQISDDSGNYFSVFNISLNGGKLIMDNTNPDTSFMPLNFELDVSPSAGVGLDASEEVKIQLNIGQMIIKGAFGSVGSQDIQLIKDQELNIDLFDRFIQGNISFANPRFSMTVHSSFGLPIGFVFEDVNVTMKDSSVIEFTIDEDYFLVDGPDFSNFGQTVTSVIALNRDNSNINSLFTTDLRKLLYSVRLLTNPESTGLSENYFLDISSIAVEYELLLPMNLRAESLILQDTIDFDIFSIEEGRILDIEALKVNIETENGMPLDLDLQVFFLDSNWVVLDSLFSEGASTLLASGELDDNGRIIEPQISVSTVDMTLDQIDKILDAKYAFFQIKIKTTDSDQRDVKFFADYKLGFSLSTEVDVVLKTSSD